LIDEESDRQVELPEHIPRFATASRVKKTNNNKEALLTQRNRTSTLSVEIVQKAAQMFDGLQLKKPATGE